MINTQSSYAGRVHLSLRKCVVAAFEILRILCHRFPGLLVFHKSCSDFSPFGGAERGRAATLHGPQRCERYRTLEAQGDRAAPGRGKLEHSTPQKNSPQGLTNALGLNGGIKIGIVRVKWPDPSNTQSFILFVLLKSR